MVITTIKVLIAFLIVYLLYQFLWKKSKYSKAKEELSDVIQEEKVVGVKEKIVDKQTVLNKRTEKLNRKQKNI